MMASYGQHHMASRAAAPRQSQHHHHHGGHGASVPGISGPPAPAGTFQPGTKIQVGSHRVVIVKYLSEGGFAHVYVVKMPQPVNGTDQAVLKRVAVPDKEALKGMRTEVETMKRLKGHRMIVTYIDSHASEMRGGGYEVFLLMEFCSGGGLIDLMNTRLQHRLTEPEILDIFCDIAEGVACMHYLKPPLLHRDLKIENVLITSRGGSSSSASHKRFKLCDFGSSAPPTPAPTSVTECRLMDEDVQKHTTLQYRSPEMVDVYRKQPLNEKADIWALGVFLYKLCYYTTPFEDQGQLAILNASYRFPSAPLFSDRLKRLIASMLKENPGERPNIYQVVKEACTMHGREVPIRDIYSGTSSSGPGSSGQASNPTQKAPAPAPAPVGAVLSRPVEEKETIPDVTPMRRGRPAPSPVRPPVASPAPRPVSLQQAPPKASGLPSSKPSGGDPFAALDSKASALGSTNPDEFSSRFPSLDQFSLLHDQGSKFEFDATTPTSATQPNKDADGSAYRMAEEAFASSKSPPIGPAGPRPQSVAPAAAQSAAKVVPGHVEALPKTASGPAKAGVSRAQSIISSNPDLQNISSQKLSNYVSTGTSTSDLPFDPVRKVSHRLSQIQASGPHRMSEQPVPGGKQEQQSADAPPPSVSARVSSFKAPPAMGARSSSASRMQKLEEDLLDIAPTRSARPRPHSTILETTSTVDYLREREAMSRPQSRLAAPRDAPSPLLWANLASTDNTPPAGEPTKLDLLSGPEEPRPAEPSDSTGVSRQAPSSSSTPPTRNTASGTFGDAFKRFEGGGGSAPQARSPSPLKQDTPTSEPGAAAVTLEVRGNAVPEDPEDMTPEMRREMERLMLQEEEERVEAAQAEYRKRVAAGGGGGGPPGPALGGARNTTGGGAPQRSASIQSRVQGLLAERQSPAQIPRTAQGYGKYSDATASASAQDKDKPLPAVPRKPLGGGGGGAGVGAGAGAGAGQTAPRSLPPKPSAAAGKPVAPKKPVHLNSIPTGTGSNISTDRPASPPKRSQPAAQEQLIAVDLPGQPTLDMTAAERDSYLEEFSHRFPSLGSIEDGASRS